MLQIQTHLHSELSDFEKITNPPEELYDEVTMATKQKADLVCFTQTFGTCFDRLR